MKLEDMTIVLNTAHLVANIRAISKHLNNLADELDIIRNTICPECGDTIKAHAAASLGMVFCACPRCKYVGFHKAEYFTTNESWRSGTVGVDWDRYKMGKEVPK